MGKKTPTTVSFDLPDGREVTIETGKLASLADGSCVVRVGKTMLFCSVVSQKEPREGASFFPLSVDYQEKFAAAGRIPGNFFRRETKLNDYEVLVSRLVDRAIRPLFPDGYRHDTQVIINLISSDGEELPDAYAALACSAALSVSNINFEQPISEVRVARIDGKYHINPTRAALEEADLELIVAATEDNVMMVEGEGKEVEEEAIIAAIKEAHEAIKVQIAAQKELAQKVGDAALIKRELAEQPADAAIEALVAERASAGIKKIAGGALAKYERKDGFSNLKQELVDAYKEELGDDEELDTKVGFFKSYYNKLQKKLIRQMVLEEGKRLDGRKTDQVRDIWTEIDYLPSTHGSAIFTRGETQSLTSVTLGTKTDSQMVDVAAGLTYSKFILHYNFPAYSVGETKPMRGPGRREVGHANLAGRSLKQVMPDDWAYTTRIVSDIMESNGSSSMATVCAGSMALMDAGVPLKRPVAGIAMGMIAEGGDIAILSDILGDEDALGDMDFKVTGTSEGITACQMDIKIDGLPYEQLEKALYQAKEGRLHILGEMAKTIESGREEMKSHVPRLEQIVIDKSFIGAVIGPGGKIIQDIQEQSGATVNIEEIDGKGYVTVSSPDKPSIDKAMARIKEITFTPEVGDVFDGVVATVMPYGVFVDFAGKSGLLHVSEMSYERVDNVEDNWNEGDAVKVKIVDIDERTGKLRLSKKALETPPEGWTPPPPRGERRDRGDRGDRRGGGGRGRGRDRGDRGDRRGGGGRDRGERRERREPRSEGGDD